MTAARMAQAKRETVLAPLQALERAAYGKPLTPTLALKQSED